MAGGPVGAQQVPEGAGGVPGRAGPAAAAAVPGAAPGAARLWVAVHSLDRVAADLVELARRAAAADGVAWQSVAAAAFRRRLAEQVDGLDRTAAEVRGAAEAVARHAAAVAARPPLGPSGLESRWPGSSWPHR